ncbi:MAG: hypothetical protein U5L96_20400 [Owenweeksia sp.]|nr:hypothetical protein [Owenweeksia sp.]
MTWEDNEDATAANNYFDNCNRGFDLKGDNSNSQFTCNTFHNCYHGIWLDNTIIDDQGSSSEATDNCWTYLYGMSTFPYGESVAGSLNASVLNLNWHMSPPSSCASGGSRPMTVNVYLKM